MLYAFVLIHILSSALVVSSLKNTQDEEEWIKIYGTHRKYSGSWPLARYLRQHLDQLKLFCDKAHALWTNTTETTMEAYVNHWLITFDNERYKPIWADMIMYAEEKEREQPEILVYNYIIKGNRADCVFYMDRVRRDRVEGAEMLFGDHVCGITGFEKFDSNKRKK